METNNVNPNVGQQQNPAEITDSVLNYDMFAVQETPSVFDEILNEELKVTINDAANEDHANESNEPENNDVDVFSEIMGIEDVEEDERNKASVDDNKKRGRPLNSIIKKLVDDNILAPFEEEKTIDQYTQEDIYELIKANVEQYKDMATQEAIDNFLNSMPTELQILLKYYGSGGTNIKDIIKMIDKISDISSLEVGKDDETIVRLYLKNTNFGDDDDIEEQIEALKESNKLQSMAEKYKGKLEAMQKEIIDKEIEKNNKIKEEQEQLAKKFISDVNKTLSVGEINGIKISKDKANELINSLTTVQYESISGRRTNKLGMLLEKYQFKEPNLALIAEVVWLLENPEEYRNKLKELGKQEAITDVKRKLKTEQNRNNIDVSMNADENKQASIPRKIKTVDVKNKFFSH